MRLNIKKKYNKIYSEQLQTPNPKKWKLVISKKPGPPGWVENYYESKVDIHYTMIVQLIEETIISVKFYHRGEPHREDGPAVIEYRGDGSIYRETWYRSGKLHRVGGPALIYYHDDDSVDYDGWTQWWQDGVRLNEDGTPYVKYVPEDETDDWNDEWDDEWDDED